MADFTQREQQIVGARCYKGMFPWLGMLSYLDIVLIGIKEPTRVAESLNRKERFPMYSLFDSNFISIMDLIFKSTMKLA